MKRNFIEDWGLMPIRGHWRSQGWRWFDWVLGSACYTKGELKAAVSAHLYGDDERWLHLSVSRADRVPDYEELVEARRAFLGDRLAYQVFVPMAEHFNLHPNCLHLWAPIDHRPTPDFRGPEGEI